MAKAMTKTPASHQPDRRNTQDRSSFVDRMGLQRIIVFCALLVLIGLFSLLGQGFATWPTLLNIAKISYYIGFLAIGLTFVFGAAGMDISTGTGMSCIGLIGGYIFLKTQNVAVSMLCCLLMGIVLGLINGFLIAYGKINAFIVTMAMQMITRGFGSIITNVQTMYWPQGSQPGAWYSNLFLWKIPGLTGSMSGGLPSGLLLLFLFALLASIVLRKTRIGRYTIAIGSNKEAARLSGVNTEKWELLTYVISGFCAGLGAIAFAASYISFLPGANDGFEMQAIAAMVIGGTSISGGTASIGGTVIGVFIMSVLKAGLPTVGLQPHYQLVFTGIILIIAVYSDVFSRRMANR